MSLVTIGPRRGSARLVTNPYAAVLPKPEAGPGIRALDLAVVLGKLVATMFLMCVNVATRARYVLGTVPVRDSIYTSNRRQSW